LGQPKTKTCKRGKEGKSANQKKCRKKKWEEKKQKLPVNEESPLLRTRGAIVCQIRDIKTSPWSGGKGGYTYRRRGKERKFLKETQNGGADNQGRKFSWDGGVKTERGKRRKESIASLVVGIEKRKTEKTRGKTRREGLRGTEKTVIRNRKRGKA